MDDFGGQARPCTGWGQGLEIDVQKDPFHEFLVTHLGAHLRHSVIFDGLFFSQFSGDLSFPNLNTLVAKGITKGCFLGPIFNNFTG